MHNRIKREAGAGRAGWRRAARGAVVPGAVLVVVLGSAVMLDRRDHDDFSRRCRAAGGEVLHDGLEHHVACVKPGSVIDLSRPS